MKIAYWTAILIWGMASIAYLLSSVEVPTWVELGSGTALGGTLRVVWLEIKASRTPQQPRKGYPTTPR